MIGPGLTLMTRQIECRRAEQLVCHAAGIVSALVAVGVRALRPFKQGFYGLRGTVFVQEPRHGVVALVQFHVLRERQIGRLAEVKAPRRQHQGHGWFDRVAADDDQPAALRAEVVVVSPEAGTLECEGPETSGLDGSLRVELGVDLVCRVNIRCGPEHSLRLVCEQHPLPDLDFEPQGTEAIGVKRDFRDVQRDGSYEMFLLPARR